MTDSQRPAEGRGQPHLRLTPDEVLDNWRNHFYTPAGYLYHLILALRREGWWYRIENVSSFCRRWELNRRTFYRVKAELVILGKLEEHISGPIDIRIPGVSQIDSPVSPVTQGVTHGSQGVSHGSHLSLETGSGQGFPDPTDLSQIFLNSFKERERESGEFSTGNAEADQEESATLDPDTQPSAPTDPPVEPEPPDETESSAEGDDDFFDWVLAHKVPRLPTKPASPRSAAKGWIEKHGVQLYAEYQTWLAAPQRSPTAYTGPPPPPPTEDVTPAERLRRYQQLWQNPICRNGIRKAIDDNPDWNLEIGPDGPQEVNHADD
ncbi:hypothetical protein H6F75_26020 [Nodosilinea sp. FACHB-131]|uniref:hypothetical protein n=1 Tax=Cyanophyceae TaxID=3028117 RepID=UPI001686C4F8|nr:hypothetical protein [Nodosilinea sp. FACHB-131]MBD1876946.1 hypothetical protein [Nodosilinea sp. FACHB-131]